MYGSSPYRKGELAATMALQPNPKQRRTYGEQASPDIVGGSDSSGVAANMAVQDSAMGAAGTKGGTTLAAETTAPAASGAGVSPATMALIGAQIYGQAKKAQYPDKVAEYEAHLDHRNAMAKGLDQRIQILTRGRIV